MKRCGNLYSKIIDEENIRVAFNNAAKGKRHYSEVKRVFLDLDKYVEELRYLLFNKSFKCSNYIKFIKIDKGKEREIFKLPFFPDRVIQHALMQVLEPIWKRSLVSCTYQAIRGRGVHSCLKDVVKAVNSYPEDFYCLQLDIEKFYPSIDNNKLKGVIRRKIKCRDTLDLMDLIIDNSKGVPIGNYISQYFGNIYLNPVDRFIKERLKVKDYFRYCDDLILIHNSKEFLWECFLTINELVGELGLTLKEDYKLYKVNSSRGVDCFGFIVHPNGVVKVRKTIIRNYSKEVRRMKSRRKVNFKILGSYFGWWKHSTQQGEWKKITLPLLKVASKGDRKRLLTLNRRLSCAHKKCT